MIRILTHLNLLAITFLLFIANQISAQSLVPNGDFETFSPCPSTLNNVNDSENWLSATDGSPDYFNSCADGASGVDVPANFYGVQLPHSGFGYAGFLAYAPDNSRDYVTIALDQTMIPGFSYCVSFQVSLADFTFIGVENIGLYFSTSQVSVTNGGLYLGYTPQIEYSNGVIADKSENWVTISGTVVADAPYQWITIGNFNSNANTNAQDLSIPGVTGPLVSRAYYYLDDVEIYELPPFEVISPSPVLCEPGNISLSATGGDTYTWANATDPFTILGTGSTFNSFLNTTTTYLVKAINGLCTRQETVTIIVLSPPPVADFTYIGSCAGSSTVLIDLSSNIAPGSLYEWDFDDDGLADAFTLGGAAYSFPQVGTYPVTLTIYALGGICEIATTISVEITEECNPCESSNSFVNLIPNPQAEYYSACPSALGNLSNASPWFSPTTSSPDFLHQCNTGVAGAPVNSFGVTAPLSGKGYLGLFSYGANYREYASTRLTETLVPGQTYCVSFNVHLSTLSGKAIDQLGAYFSTDSIGLNTQAPLFLTPDVSNDAGNIIDDSQGWVTISGTYTPTTPVAFVTIGNFYDDATTQSADMPNPAPSIALFAYYYIDDISVSPVPELEVAYSPVSCINSPSTFTVNGSFCSYEWYDLSNPGVVLSTEQSLTVNVSTPSVKQYIVWAQYGQCNVSQTITVIYISPPTVGFEVFANCAGGATVFLDNSLNVLPGALYAWDFENDGIINSTQSSFVAHIYQEPGSYLAKLTITNPGGCSQTALVSVFVEVCTQLCDNDNVVQDGSFELGACPTQLGQADNLDFWQTPGTGSCATFTHPCVNLILQTITPNGNGSNTLSFSVTNLCPQPFVFVSFQLPDGTGVDSPADGSNYVGTQATYFVSQPVNAPFNAILYFDPNNATSTFADGQTEIFEYTLPAGVAVPANMQFLVQIGTGLSVLGSISTQVSDCFQADWFNTCGGESEVGIPQNAYGSQLPLTGNGYIGITTDSNTPSIKKQYINTQLDAPLVVGQLYCATMYVSLADSSQFAVTDLGMYFSTVALNEALNLQEAPQVYNPQANYLYDTENWVAITNTFIATQPYEYIAIGNFGINNDALVSVSPYSTGYAYYYIDNIVVSPLIVDAPDDVSTCLNSTISLTASTNTCETYWYEINSPNNILSLTNTLTVSITDTMTFVVAGKNGNCVLSDTVTVYPYPLPEAEAGASVDVCLNEPVQLQASGGDTYQWLPEPNSFISDPNIANPFVTGFVLDNFYFKVIVTNNLTGCQAIDSVRVKTLQLPTANILEPDTVYVCTNDPTSLSATGGTGGGTIGVPYEWQPSGNIIGSNLVANPIVSITDTTVFTVTVTQTFTGCQDVASVVLVPQVIYNTPTDTLTICSGDAAILNPDLPAADLVGYQWSPNINLSETDIANPTTFTTTSLIYTLTYTDELGCTGQSLVYVRVIPRPNTGSDIQICEGGSAQLFASGGGLSYSWQPTTGLNNPNIQNPIATPSETTVYTVTVVYPDSDEADCTNTDDVAVYVNSTGFAFAGEDVVICEGNTTQLNAIGGDTYSWSPSEGLSETNIPNPIASPENSTVYTVTVTNSITGCQSTDDVLVAVDIPSLPVFNTPNGIVYCADPLVPIQICYSASYSGCAPLIPNIVTQLSSSVSLNGTFCFTYLSAFATAGMDTVTIQLCAGNTGCSQITTIIANCDAPPVWSQQALSINTCVNNAVTVALPPVINLDEPNDQLTYTVGTPVNGTVNIIGNVLTYIPTNGFSGSDFFDVTVCDSLFPFDDCAVLPVVVNVMPNNPPIASNQTVSIEYQTPTTICLNITEPDGQGTTLSIVSIPLNGSISVINGTCVSYTPNLGYSGSDAVVINVCDPCGDCTLIQLLLNVQPKPNVPPVSPDIVVNIPYNTSQVICLDVFDEDGDPTSTQLVSGTVNGVLLVDALANCITFTPNTGFSGVNVIIVSVCDGISGCDQVTITLNVLPPPNLPPIVNNVISTTAYNTPVFICLGIVEPNGNPYTVAIQNFPANGTVVQPILGCFIYTPEDFVGTDVIEVIVCDNLGACNTATISINVLPQTNQAPIVPDLTVVVPNNTNPVTACLSIIEPDGNNYTTSILYNGIYGSVVINNPDCFTYTPTAQFTTFDIVQLNVCDEVGACTVVNVYFVSNAAPSFNNVSVTTPQNVPVNVCLTITDPEDEDYVLTILGSSPTNGTASLNNDTCILYTPNTDFVGSDQITVQVCDINGNCSVGTININVQQQTNQAPLVNNVFATTAFNTPITICVPITDPEGDNFNTLFGDSSDGTVITLSNTCFTYIPNLNFSGTDLVSVLVCDVFGNCSTANVFVTVFANLPPVAPNVTITTNINTPIQACISPTDPENDETNISITTPPNNGTAIILNETCISYNPALGFVGTDIVVLELCDVFGNCNPVTITIQVTSDNSAPIVTTILPIVLTVGTNESVCIEAIDPNGDNLTYTITGISPNVGSGSITDNCLSFTAPQSGTGTVVVTVQVCDDGIPPICTTIDITFVLNNAPSAPSQTVTTPQSMPIELCLSVTEPEGNSYTLNATTLPDNGTINIVGDCIIYTPDPLFVGTETIVIELCDQYGACDVTTLTINVLDGLIANDTNTSTEDNVPLVIDILDNDTYPDDGTIIVTILEDPTSGTVIVNEDHTITYIPELGFSGTDTFQYILCHPVLGCDTATVVVTVNNALAAFDDIGITTFADVSVNIPILGNDIYPDLTNLNITIINSVNVNGFVSQIGTTGVFSFLPAAGFSGIDTFEYVICYPALGCDTAMVIVNVILAPQYPNAVDDAVTTQMGNDIVINVLNNDTNPLPGDLVVVDIVTLPTNGTATINIDQTVTYSPNSGFYGIDVFTYVICNPNYGDGETICDTATVTVTVVNPVACIPKAYQAISPNSDGKNDFFVIENIDCNGYNLNELVIFNRWGNIVFEAKNYSAATFWNGTFKDTGNFVPNGTYFYLFKTNTGDIILQGYLEVNQ